MKILIIEDEIKTVQSLRTGFEEEGMAVEVAYDGQTGRLLAERGDFDVIISDVIMPHVNGYELVRQLRQLGNTTPILLLTALGESEDIVSGLDVGADDYLAKPFQFKVLLARVRALARRREGKNLPKNILTFADVEINLDAKTCIRAGKKVDLTPKEFAFMVYLIQHAGRVISKTEIAEKVWDIHFDTGTNVIEVYVNYLRNKIDKPFDRRLIHTVFGAGYVLKMEE